MAGKRQTPARERARQFPLSPIISRRLQRCSPEWVGKPDLLCQADSRDEL